VLLLIILEASERAISNTYVLCVYRVRCWGDAWECEYDGPIKMQKVCAMLLIDS
jgi:hypothetical protein